VVDEAVRDAGLRRDVSNARRFVPAPRKRAYGGVQDLPAPVDGGRTGRRHGRESLDRTKLESGAVGLRICLVTPFSWSQPHSVNEHVEGVAEELRRRGHAVTVLAPSNRARDLAAGRRALQTGASADVIALGPAVPISRRSQMGVPVGVRENLTLALAEGRYDVVHGFEPGLPSLSYLALREAQTLAVATFFSSDRLAYPPGKTQRERLLGRVDALLATTEATAAAARERFPGDFTVLSEAVDVERFAPTEKRRLIVAEWRPPMRPIARSLLRALRELPDWELVFVRTRTTFGRPFVPRAVFDRVAIRTLRTGESRRELLNAAAIFVPAPQGLNRLRLEAAASGAAIAEPPGVDEQPELAAAAVARLAEDAGHRGREQAAARAWAKPQSFAAVAGTLADLYARLSTRRRPRADGDPLADRPWILTDLHLHTSWSSDCQIPVEDLVDHAEEQGLGAIAITDHNVFGGALEAVELANGRDLIVIPGEEIKTDHQGEVIGLFLREEIPRGMTFADTIAAIGEQDGIVYLPHPFDRIHTCPDPATVHRHLAEIDILEVYNARLLFDAYNEEALRFARKYGLTMGAGSDAHVLQGVGTGVMRMRAFDGPEEFLLSLRTAQVLRRPRSLLYLQSLKWAAQAKERVR
jgi:predicted metal-dependent phosphoesterase TrpH